MTAVAAMAYSIEEIPNVHLTDKTQYVSNPDGVLRQTTVDSLNRSIAIVVVLLSDAPMAEQRSCVVVDVVAVDRVHHHCHYFSRR